MIKKRDTSIDLFPPNESVRQYYCIWIWYQKCNTEGSAEGSRDQIWDCMRKTVTNARDYFKVGQLQCHESYPTRFHLTTSLFLSLSMGDCLGVMQNFDRTFFQARVFF